MKRVRYAAEFKAEAVRQVTARWHSVVDVEKTVKEITALNALDQAKFELFRQGGTHIWAAVGFVSALFAALILVAVIAES